MSKNAVIIVAGGSGTRLGSDIPKQFLLLGGKPIIMRTIEKFVAALENPKIIVALPKDHFELWRELVVEHNFTTEVELVAGGETRFHSVKNAMNVIDDCAVVGIHDAVRPLIDPQLIQELFSKAKSEGGAIPVAPLSDSIRILEEEESRSVDRSNYVSVQTPQCFQFNLLKQGYEKSYHETFTDDAAVFESLGHQVFLIQNNSANLKITFASDLKIAELLSGY